MIKNISFALLLLLLAAFKHDFKEIEECNNAYNKKNYNLAFKLCKPLADNGVIHAEIHIAQMYFNGQGMSKDHKNGILWYKKAASNQTNPASGTSSEEAAKIQIIFIKQAAEYRIAKAYFNGSGVEKDSKQGVEWLKKSAERGLEWAQFDLAVKYFKGENVDANRDESFKWMERSANQGFRQAQVLMLAFVKEQVSLVEAYKWCKIASNNKSPTLNEWYQKNLEQMAGALPLEMTTEQITQGRDLANEWKPKQEASNSIRK